MLTVSESLCHPLGHVKHAKGGCSRLSLCGRCPSRCATPRGTLNIPGRLSRLSASGSDVLSTYSRDQTTSTETDCSTRALVLDRVGSPGKHRRGVRVDRRLVAHLCWFETNVGTQTVSRTDERLIFYHHWSDEPTMTGTGVDGNRYDTPDVLQQPQFWSCPSPNGTYTKCCFLDLPVVITIGNHPRVQETRRPPRIRLFPRALVLDRSWFPGFITSLLV